MENPVTKAKKQRGVSLLLALMMVTLIVFLVVFVSAISTGQLKFSGSAVDSSRAFSAADAGIEYALSRINSGLAVGENAASCSCDSGTWCPGIQFTSSSVYCLIADNPTSPRKITAVGRTTDTNVRRSLEILVPAYAAATMFNTFCVNDATLGASSLDPNTYCVARGYSGATGLFGNTGTQGCDRVAPTTNLVRTVNEAGTSQIVNGLLSGNYYFVQCYK